MEDETDKLISLKAMNISYIIVGLRFVVALLISYLSMSVSVIFT
jgi:hypothetical protein